MGGGKGKSSPPPQIDPGKSMGEFYFGKGFSNYQGVTDPRLQELFLGAEATYRPEYTALELADIGVMARGLGEREVADPRYTQAQDRISGLQAELAKTPDTISETRKTGLHGRNRSRTETVSVPNPKRAELEREIASQQELIAGLSPTKMQSATPGLFDLLEEQSTRAGALQREELQLQRESDVGALREFAPQVVEAYRAADPYSTELADLASRRAQEDLGLSAKGQALLDDPAFAEQEALLKQRGMEFAASTGQLSPLEQRGVAQQARAASVARGRAMDQSGLYGEMQARMSEELGKREREIALGSQLLGQEAGLRAQRMGLGAGLIGQEASIGSQRLGQAFGMQRQMAGDIGSVLLGRPSAAIGLGGQMLGQAQAGAAGPMGPQLFDPNVGINMALQQRGQDVTFQGMQAQAKAAGQAGFMGAIGAIGGGFLGRG
jgi:hypothetical protein